MLILVIPSVAHSKSDNMGDAISSAFLGPPQSMNEQPECRAVLADQGTSDRQLSSRGNTLYQ